MADSTPTVLERVRKSLGRTQPLTAPPTPPTILEPCTRLVHSDIGLPELFTKRADANKMHAQAVSPEELPGKISSYFQSKNIRRIAVPVSETLERLGIPAALRSAGLEVKTWDQMTLDELYDFDAAVTDVSWAIAETGSLVIKSDPRHGRAISLVPMVHVAVVEAKNCLPDLIDLMEILGREGVGNNVTIITGPSKTADIEGALVTGVHGPGELQVFVLK